MVRWGPIATGSKIADVSGNGNTGMTMQGSGANLVAGKYHQGFR